MSFGSGIRFQVDQGRGKPSIFWQEEKRKNDKKFDYKTKNQRFQVRKKYPEEPKSTYNPIRNGKQPLDFISKNREHVRGNPAEKPGNKVMRPSPNSVTLTQTQLNAILASVGKLTSGKESSLRLSIDSESNEIHIESSRGDTDSEKGEQDGKKENEEGTISALAADKNESERNEPKEDYRQRHDGKYEVQTKKEQDTIDKFSPHNTSFLNEWHLGCELPPLVPKAHLTVAEKKRLQWAQEKAELQQLTYEVQTRPTAIIQTKTMASQLLTDVPATKHVLPSSKSVVTKEEERRMWLNELDKQREEQRQQRLRQRQEDQREADNSWADRFTTDYKPAPLPEQIHSRQGCSSVLSKPPTRLGPLF